MRSLGMEGLEIGALEESTNLLKLTLRAAQAGSWAWDVVTGDVFWSEEFHRLVGTTAETCQPSYEAWLRTIHPEDREAAAREMQRAMRERSELSNEFRIIRPDGSVRWVRSQGRAVYGEGGEPLRMVGVAFDITERRLAEEALQRREEELRIITNGVPALISYIDAEQRYQFNNRMYEEWFGHSREELSGRHVREVLGDAAYEEVRPHIESVLAGREVRFESWVPYQGVGSRCVEVRYVPHSGPQGETRGFFALVVDVTERKRTEAALRESEERFHTAVENMLDCFGIYSAVRDGDGKIVDFRIDYVNAAACDNNLLAREEQIGRLLCEILPNHRESGLFAEYCRVVETGEPLVKQTLDYEDEYSPRRLKRSFDIRAVKLGDGFIATWRDVTEQKRNEERYRLQAEEFTTLMNTTPAAIWIAHDPGCLTITGSQAGYELLRTPTGANISKSAGEAKTAPHYKVLNDGVELAPDELPMQRAARGAEIRGFEEEIVFDDGDRLHLFGNAMPLHGPDGGVRGAVGAFVDITQRKRAEEALKESDRRKDEFLAMLAHELRNPLAPIRNAVQVMRQLGSPDARLQHMRDVVDRQTDQLARMVDDLLDVSRISLGKVALRREKADLLTIIGRAVETSRPLIDANGHRLTVSLPPESLRVEGDVARLAQVLSNLLNNAAKYTEKGGDIWLTAEARGPEVEIRVKDTGIGIPAEILPHVFDLFTQADRTLDRSQGGLGIGLTLVKRIVELHGGTVRALSAGPGEGSELIVRLPLRAEPAHPAPDDPGVPAGERKDFSSHLRILVVDDNVDTAESLALLLELGGQDVRTAHDGIRALEIAEAFQPHVALLDIGLPGMSGHEVARRLRQQPGMRRALLIALSGYGQEEDRQRALDAGFDHYLIKPVDYGELKALINSRGRAD